MYAVLIKYRTDGLGRIEEKDSNIVNNLSDRHQSISKFTPLWLFRDYGAIPTDQKDYHLIHVFKEGDQAKGFKEEIDQMDEVVSIEMVDLSKVRPQCFTRRIFELTDEVNLAYVGFKEMCDSIDIVAEDAMKKYENALAIVNNNKDVPLEKLFNPDYINSIAQLRYDYVRAVKYYSSQEIQVIQSKFEFLSKIHNDAWDLNHTRLLEHINTDREEQRDEYELDETLEKNEDKGLIKKIVKYFKDNYAL